jgi:hypothetical protein
MSIHFQASPIVLRSSTPDAQTQFNAAQVYLKYAIDDYASEHATRKKDALAVIIEMATQVKDAAAPTLLEKMFPCVAKPDQSSFLYHVTLASALTQLKAPLPEHEQLMLSTMKNVISETPLDTYHRATLDSKAQRFEFRTPYSNVVYSFDTSLLQVLQNQEHPCDSRFHQKLQILEDKCFEAYAWPALSDTAQHLKQLTTLIENTDVDEDGRLVFDAGSISTDHLHTLLVQHKAHGGLDDETRLAIAVLEAKVLDARLRAVGLF